MMQYLFYSSCELFTFRIFDITLCEVLRCNARRIQKMKAHLRFHIEVRYFASRRKIVAFACYSYK